MKIFVHFIQKKIKLKSKNFKNVFNKIGAFMMRLFCLFSHAIFHIPKRFFFCVKKGLGIFLARSDRVECLCLIEILGLWRRGMIEEKFMKNYLLLFLCFLVLGVQDLRSSAPIVTKVASYSLKKFIPGYKNVIFLGTGAALGAGTYSYVDLKKSCDVFFQKGWSLVLTRKVVPALIGVALLSGGLYFLYRRYGINLSLKASVVEDKKKNMAVASRSLNSKIKTCKSV